MPSRSELGLWIHYLDPDQPDEHESGEDEDDPDEYDYEEEHG